MPSPSSGAQMSHALGQLLASGITQLNSLGDEAFFAPQGAAWSPAEHIRHLRKSAAPLVMALGLPRWLVRFRFGVPTRASRSYDEVRDVYLQKLAAGATAGRFTPSPEAQPGNLTARRQEILSDWARATTGLQNAIAKWPEDALDRHQLPHPLLGPLTVREMLAFTVYHTSHHLNRIAERQASTHA